MVTIAIKNKTFLLQLTNDTGRSDMSALRPSNLAMHHKILTLEQIGQIL